MGTRELRATWLAPLLLLATACHGYYPTWHYAPRHEVHSIHLQRADSSEPAATVDVHVVGILRPVEGGPRRADVRIDVENRGAGTLTFQSGATTLRAGTTTLRPESGADVAVEPHGRTRTELFFALPDPPTLQNSELEELELTWSVVVDGTPVSSRTSFHRAFDAYGPAYYDPWWYDRPYGWYDPWGPGWSVRTRVVVVHH